MRFIPLIATASILFALPVHAAHVHGSHGSHVPNVNGARHQPAGHASGATPARFAATSGGTTGSGAYVFRHLPVEFPTAMAEHLVNAHGGFAQDHEAAGGDGSTYFSLKGVGILRLAPDLSSIAVVGGDKAIRGVNLHNTCLFREAGEPYLALPSDEAQRAFLATLDGELLRTFPNPYGEDGAPFRVCDLEYVDGQLFATNGYADNVCFATLPLQGSEQDPLVGVWQALRFGGSGREHGKFGTAHGITRFPGSDTFTIADRANARLESYSRAGRYIGGIDLPEGCMPCDVDYHGDLALVGCLKGPGGATPAPIYILEQGNLVAELNIGRDLGLEGFTHIHNAAFRSVRQPDGRERLYVLAYAWNPGNFAILEQVID
ncbi:MAG: hypothetical protein ACI8QZ_000549 [Chlamydiales bacterium]|jgi:hypothetical protein